MSFMKVTAVGVCRFANVDNAKGGVAGETPPGGKIISRELSCKAFLPAEQLETRHGNEDKMHRFIQREITIQQRTWPCAGEFLQREAGPCRPAYYRLNVEFC